ncbi:hypothetical protein QWY79_08495 [Halomonas sabkhae]|uniref:ribosome modulation factor n=1 Tax=Halomonas sabkhae TaxID=626223 RepID=UPI0025B580FE|nr:hypothetical protein [Halomonas sabkhae]MDN3525310.1 hypothetical protein [Halomonas sabkhae]
MTGSRATSRTRIGDIMRDAMVFASQADDPRAFLQAWLEGDWPLLRQEWPAYEVPRDLEAGELGPLTQEETTWALRLIALSTEDPLARDVALYVIGETADQARQALLTTAWGRDLSDLREAVSCRLSDAERADRHPEECLEGGWEAFKRDTDAAYAAGIEAFDNGMPLSANPHAPLTHQHPAWAAGWSDAERYTDTHD